MEKLTILKNNIGTLGKYLMIFNFFATILIVLVEPQYPFFHYVFDFIFCSITIVPIVFRPLEKDIHKYKDLYINYIVYPTIILLTMSWIGMIIFPDTALMSIPIELRKILFYTIYGINLFALLIYYFNVYLKYKNISFGKRMVYEVIVVLIIIFISFLLINVL